MGHAGGTGLKEPPTLLILPCSKRKNPPKSPVVSLGSRTVLDVLQRTASQLQQGRRGCAASVDWSSAEFAALDYYDGHLYRVSYLREKLARELTSGNVGTLILSGAYGVVLAEERIHKYDRHMDAGYWLRLRLNEVIGEFVEQTASQRVYIFLAAKSPYVKIIERVNWGQLKAMRQVREAMFVTVNSDGLNGAQQIVPRLLGEAIVELLNGHHPTAANKLLACRIL